MGYLHAFKIKDSEDKCLLLFYDMRCRIPQKAS